MDREKLKGLLLQRLYIELQVFKDSILQKGKEDIFNASYEIEAYVNLYEILAAHVENLKTGMIRKLLRLDRGILEHIYLEWLTQEDSFYEALRAFACGELEGISGLGCMDCGKGEEDGAKLNQAA